MRLGIVGCGLIGGKRMASALKGGHNIVAVADLDPSRAQGLAKTSGAKVVDQWRDVIAADVDVVVVATTHDMLTEVALTAVEAGHHVLVEKPAGRNAQEVRPLLEAARAKQRIVKVGFNHRFHPALLKAKELVDAGEAGPLMYIRGRYGHGGRPGMEKEWRCKPELSGGGELIDQGPHLIDLSRWFLGDLSLEYGVAPTMYWDIPTDDNCFLALKSQTGALAWLHATWTEWKNMFSFEIVGRDAKLVVDGLGGSYGLERLTYYKMLPQMGPPETTIWEYPFPDASWDLEFQDFEQALKEGRRPLGDIEDAYAMLQIVDRVYQRGAQ
jgi:predicted dehydrogenase